MQTTSRRLTQSLVKAIIKARFRFKSDQMTHIPASGPAVLAVNSVSFIDPFLVLAALRRPALFLVNSHDLDQTRLKPLLVRCGVIGVDFTDESREKAAYEIAGRVLTNGGLVVVFPEGNITRTGFLNSFDIRYAAMAKQCGCPVIPLYIDYMRGSRQKIYGKDSIRISDTFRTQVSVVCGTACNADISPFKLRQRMEELSIRAYELRKLHRHSLGYKFVCTARRNWSRQALSDTTGTRVTFGKALISSLALAGIIRKNHGNEPMIGVILPATAGAALVNIGITLAGKVPVNLNFTSASENIAYAASLCGLATVITSKKFLRKMQNLAVPGNTVFVEDIMRAIGTARKLWALAKALVYPAGVLAHEKTSGPDDCATIVFSSGSTANPKGIVLTHHNIISNIEQMHTVIDLHRNDCMCGVLPFFHSFGLTATLWFPLIAGFRAAYHPNPLDSSTIASMVKKERGTLFLATPTFLQAYMRKAAAEDFTTLRITICGAEKLKPVLANAFKEKFGTIPLEGFGATELSPVTCLNVHDAELWGRREQGARIGTIGRLLPGMCSRLTDPDTGAPCGENKAGLLMVKGPNVMKGYLNQPEKTGEVLREGWYTTGDIVTISPDGFITHIDRLARFSKIGGEMVPHGAVEDIFANALQASEPVIAVTAVPDASRGEKIVVIYTKEAGTADMLRGIMEAAQVPNLWKPSRDAYIMVDAIPMLGTGKTDLKAVRARACAAFTETAPAR